MRGHLIAVCLLAALIAPASSALAAAPNQPPAGSGSIGIRLFELPAGAEGDSRGRSYIVHRVRPGVRIRRRVEISNSTGSTAEVALYPAAASLRRGVFAFAPGHATNDLSSWTSVGRSALRMSSQTKASVTVTIDVPKSASFGKRYAVVWAEVSARASAAGGVKLVNRVGIRIYLSIGPGGSPRSNFTIGQPNATRSPGGTPLVVARVRNTGGSTLDISGNLTLSKGPGGLRTGPFPIKLARALTPNGSATLRVQLDEQLPPGPWRAHIRLRSGLIERVAVATIRFPRQAGQPIPDDINAEWGRLNLGVIALLMFVLAMASSVLWLTRSGRSGRGEAGTGRVGH